MKKYTLFYMRIFRNIKKINDRALVAITLLITESNPKDKEIMVKLLINLINKPMKRCDWLNLNNPLYVDYHDNEWWEIERDDKKLFEMLILEWAQAGLSWETVLNKRENYRLAFDNFDAEKISKYEVVKQEELMLNPWIIRNRLKIISVTKNAKAFLEIQKEFGSFYNYLWKFIDGK